MRVMVFKILYSLSQRYPSPTTKEKVCCKYLCLGKVSCHEKVERTRLKTKLNPSLYSHLLPFTDVWAARKKISLDIMSLTVVSFQEPTEIKGRLVKQSNKVDQNHTFSIYRLLIHYQTA